MHTLSMPFTTSILMSCNSDNDRNAATRVSQSRHQLLLISKKNADSYNTPIATL
ncbi:hypothetical protein PAUR_a2666 [Pseudoalteromonas aurantia 208]|uniref:Orphan protein n=1 Tax=Pseudoalteromonas aurantia 208 TaxID=1314867 RepID=A0ABR9EDM8_9GAMM|nr:hypothetical protein [Pseudoalteromonas aurantia 208]